MVEYSADAYTLKAESYLHDVEINEELKQAIMDGKQESFIRIMQKMLEKPLTWGDHLKRYAYDYVCENGTEGLCKEKDEEFSWTQDPVFEEITEENVKAFIKRRFKKNGMDNRGSMDPEAKTELKKRLNDWMNAPVTGISRQTGFLFCFGLGLDEEEASYMLEKLRQPDFYARDYKEAIYYYCLRNHLQYDGVKKWLKIYDAIVEEWKNHSEDYREKFHYIPNPNTKALKNQLVEIAALEGDKEKRDAKFQNYLQTLAMLPVNRKRSETRASFCRETYLVVSQCLSAYHGKRLDAGIALQSFKVFERCLRNYPVVGIKVPEVFDELVKARLIKLPALTEASLEKKLGGERSSDINREDILTLVFLHYACGLEEEELEYKKRKEKFDYREKKAQLCYEWNYALEQCGFGGVYLLNPTELFLVSCLLQPKPLHYFLAVWKKYDWNWRE